MKFEYNQNILVYVHNNNLDLNIILHIQATYCSIYELHSYATWNTVTEIYSYVLVKYNKKILIPRCNYDYSFEVM